MLFWSPQTFQKFYLGYCKGHRNAPLILLHCKDPRNVALIILHSTTDFANLKEMLHSFFYILQQILQAQRNDALIILHSTTVIAKIKEMLQSLQLYNIPCYLTKGYEK